MLQRISTVIITIAYGRLQLRLFLRLALILLISFISQNDTLTMSPTASLESKFAQILESIAVETLREKNENEGSGSTGVLALVNIYVNINCDQNNTDQNATGIDCGHSNSQNGFEFFENDLFRKLSTRSVPYTLINLSLQDLDDFDTDSADSKQQRVVNFETDFPRAVNLLIVVRSDYTLTDPQLLLNLMKHLMKPHSVNRAKYIFLHTNFQNSEITLVSSPEFDFLKYKLELTSAPSRAGNGTTRVLASTFCFYCKINNSPRGGRGVAKDQGRAYVLSSYNFENTSGRMFIVRYSPTLFPDFTRNLHGTSVDVVTTLPMESIYIVTRPRSAIDTVKILSAPAIRLIESIGKSMNFTFPKQARFSKLLYQKTNGVKLGYVGQLNRPKLSVGIGYAPHSTFAKDLDFSKAYLRSWIAMLMKRQPRKVDWTAVFIIGKDFQIILTFLTVSIGILVTLVYAKLSWKRNYFEYSHYKGDSAIQNIMIKFKNNVFLVVEISLLHHSMNTITKFRSNAIKIVLYTWWLFSLFAISFHQATLTSKLVVPEMEPELRTASDLYNRDSPKYLSWTAGIASDKYMVQHIFRNTKYEKLSLSMSYFRTPLDCIQPVLEKDKFVCFSFKAILEATINLLPGFNLQKLVVKRCEDFSSSQSALAFGKHSPLLQGMDKHVEGLFEAGILARWDKEQKDSLYSFAGKVKGSENYTSLLMVLANSRNISDLSANKGDSSSRLGKFEPVVLGFLLASCFSSGIFLIELIWFYKFTMGTSIFKDLRNFKRVIRWTLWGFRSILLLKGNTNRRVW